MKIRRIQNQASQLPIKVQSQKLRAFQSPRVPTSEFEDLLDAEEQKPQRPGKTSKIIRMAYLVISLARRLQHHPGTEFSRPFPATSLRMKT